MASSIVLPILLSAQEKFGNGEKYLQFLYTEMVKLYLKYFPLDQDF